MRDYEDWQIKRGDIFYIQNAKFYTTDPENKSGRPGVIVSCDELNAHSSVVEVVYLTTKDKRPIPTHTDVLCKVPSTSICENINTVPKERLGDFVRTCTVAEMAAIERGMLHSLGIAAVPLIEREDEELDLTKISVEKDLYKRLYEQLLDRVTVR